MEFKKILIIRFSSIGDIVLTSPIIRCLKTQSQAEIHFLTKSSFATLVKDNPYIDKIHYLKEDINETIESLKLEKFDLIVDLHKNIRSIRISLVLGVKMISYHKMNFKKWLAVNLKIDSLKDGKHLVDRYFETLIPMGIKNDGTGLDYFILSEDEYDAKDLVDNIQYQVLVLGATYFTKRIPYQKCVEIINAYPHSTILIGGEDVAIIASDLAKELPQKVINYCGKIGLGVSAGILKHADRVITGDTGMMHIAAALQKKIIVLWGNTLPQFGMYPYYGQHTRVNHIDLQVEGLSCRPCSKLGFDACPKGHFRCMNDINVSDIAK